jgi:hypothetical protein
MEMFSIGGGVILFLFLLAGWFFSYKGGVKVRPFQFGCLLPGTLLLLLGAFSMGRYMALDEPLTIAATDGDVTRVRQLLSVGADPNAIFDGSRSALSSAAVNGHYAVVEILVAHGASVTTNESTPPLCAAVAGNHPDIVRLLLRHGAQMDQNDRMTGYTPLQTAQIKGYGEIKRLLLAAGARR